MRKAVFPPIAVFAAAACILSASGQQPLAPKFPAVNPAAARLDLTLGGLEGPAWAIAAASDGGSLWAACDSGAICGWNKDVALGIRGGDGPAELYRGHVGPVLALSAGSRVIVSGGADGKVIVWDIANGKPAQTLAAGAPVRAVAASPVGGLIASACEAASVQIWDAATGKPSLKLDGASDWLLSLAISVDGKALAAGGYDGKLRVWELSGGKKLVEVAAQPASPANGPAAPLNIVSTVAFSPDGKLLALGGSDGQVHVFQAADGKLLRSLPGHTGTVTSLAFHPAGELIASASKDRTIRLWNVAGGQPLKVLEGHTAWVQGVAFLARGTRLASAGADQTMRLWDLTDPQKK